MSENSCTSN